MSGRPRKLQFRAEEAHVGRRLDHVLSEWLPVALSQTVSRAQTRKLIVAGAVYLNGSRVRIASKELRKGARVEVMYDPGKWSSGAPAADRPFVMTARHVLYEDDDLIAVNKPPGLPTQPTLDEARVNLFASLKKFLRERDGTEPYLGLHHRLDRDTSGVILFTKSKRVNAAVASLFSERLAQKTYQAIVLAGRQVPRPLPRKGERWTIENHLGEVKKPGARGKSKRFGAVRSGGDYAKTDFEMLEVFDGAAWVQAQPKTGRTHQIRVHLSEAGMPILGDATYRGSGGDATYGGSGGDATYGGSGGDATSGAPRLMLHAANLTFDHPITSVRVSIQSPLPEDFSLCLQKLRRSPEESETS